MDAELKATDTMLNRHAETHVEREVIRDFLDWLDEQRWQLQRPHPTTGRWLPILEDREAMLARYFGIDLIALENERRALLAEHKARSHG